MIFRLLEYIESNIIVLACSSQSLTKRCYRNGSLVVCSLGLVDCLNQLLLYSYAWYAFLLSSIFYAFCHDLDLPSLSIMTNGTSWELAPSIHTALIPEVPGSLGSFFGWCEALNCSAPPELPRSPYSFTTGLGPSFLVEMLSVFMYDFSDLLHCFKLWVAYTWLNYLFSPILVFRHREYWNYSCMPDYNLIWTLNCHEPEIPNYHWIFESAPPDWYY